MLLLLFNSERIPITSKKEQNWCWCWGDGEVGGVIIVLKTVFFDKCMSEQVLLDQYLFEIVHYREFQKAVDQPVQSLIIKQH